MLNSILANPDIDQLFSIFIAVVTVIQQPGGVSIALLIGLWFYVFIKRYFNKLNRATGLTGLQDQHRL